jgi:hypothetical protein
MLTCTTRVQRRRLRLPVGAAAQGEGEEKGREEGRRSGELTHPCLPSTNRSTRRFALTTVGSLFLQSEEDQALKEKLELYVVRAQDADPGVQKLALERMRYAVARGFHCPACTGV